MLSGAMCNPRVPAAYCHDAACLSLSTIVIVSLLKSSVINFGYFRFALSFRDVEEMLPCARFPHLRDRPAMVSQVRSDYANGLRRRSP
jgi:hypothetical protein